MQESKWIDVYQNTFIFYHKYENTTVIREFNIPCFVEYNTRLIQIEKDRIIEYKEGKEFKYEGHEFQILLPNVLQHSKLINKDECISHLLSKINYEDKYTN